MIVFKNKGYEIRSDMPDADWLGNALYVLSDDSELATKIIESYPYYEFVVDEFGELIDIEPTERPDEPEPEPTTDFVTWDELAQAYNEGVNSVG